MCVPSVSDGWHPDGEGSYIKRHHEYSCVKFIIVENRQTSEQEHYDSNCQLPEPVYVHPLWRHCIPRSQQPHVRLSGSVSSECQHSADWLWRHHADGVLSTEGKQTLHLRVHRHCWQHDVLSCCWLLSGGGGQRTGAGAFHHSDQVQRLVFSQNIPWQ